MYFGWGYYLFHVGHCMGLLLEKLTVAQLLQQAQGSLELDVVPYHKPLESSPYPLALFKICFIE
jgi:hypothetical protein